MFVMLAHCATWEPCPKNLCSKDNPMYYHIKQTYNHASLLTGMINGTGGFMERFGGKGRSLDKY